jgi:hypothetical protein
VVPKMVLELEASKAMSNRVPSEDVGPYKYVVKYAFTSFFDFKICFFGGNFFLSLEPLNSIKDLRPYKIKKIVFDIYI